MINNASYAKLKQKYAILEREIRKYRQVWLVDMLYYTTGSDLAGYKLQKSMDKSHLAISKCYFLMLNI